MKADVSTTTPTYVLSLVEEATKDEDAVIMVHDAWCKGCAICVNVCPKDCLKMQGPVVRLTDADLCTSCGMCEYLCPDFAIFVLKLRWQKG